MLLPEQKKSPGKDLFLIRSLRLSNSGFKLIVCLLAEALEAAIIICLQKKKFDLLVLKTQPKCNQYLGPRRGGGGGGLNPIYKPGEFSAWWQAPGEQVLCPIVGYIILMDVNIAGLPVFRTVAGPRNLARSAKFRDIDKKARNPAKFTKICT